MSQDLKNINLTQNAAIYGEDDISITELLVIVWQHRFLGISIAAGTLILALVYALTATKIYRAEASFQMPLSRGVNELNVNVKGGHQYTPDDVFKYFVNNLYSYTLRKEFFQEQKLYEYYNSSMPHEESFWKNFDKYLVVSEPKANDASKFTKLSFEIDNAQKSAELLNKFVIKVEGYTVKELIDNVDNSINKRIKELKEEITSKRVLIKERREDRVVILTEALKIAEKLDIKKPRDFNRFTGSTSSSSSILVNTANMPHYALGSLAITAEIEELKSRKSDDPYIEDLRNLQEEVAYLEGLQMDSKVVHVMRVDQPAMTPDRKIKPKRTLIAGIGLIAGCILGMIGIFLKHFSQILRQEISQS